MSRQMRRIPNRLVDPVKNQISAEYKKYIAKVMCAGNWHAEIHNAYADACGMPYHSTCYLAQAIANGE